MRRSAYGGLVDDRLKQGERIIRHRNRVEDGTDNVFGILDLAALTGNVLTAFQKLQVKTVRKMRRNDSKYPA